MPSTMPSSRSQKNDLPLGHRWIPLLFEGLFFIFFSYIVLAGGSNRGQVYYELSFVNTVLSAGVCLAWFTWRMARRRSFPKTRFDLPIAAALIAYLLATAFSVDPRRSLIVFPQVVLPFAAFYFFLDLFQNKPTAGPLRQAIVFASTFPFLIGLTEIFLWYQRWHAIGGWSDPIPVMTTRITMGIGHSNTAATFLVLLLPLAIAAWFLRPRWFDRLLVAAWLLVWGVCMFFTSSRGGWLATIAALGVMIALMIADKATTFFARLRQIIRVPGKAAILGVGLVGALALAGRVALWQMNHPSHSPLLGSRGYLWIPALQAFANDVLTGNGPYTYGTEFLLLRQMPPGMLLFHAHNFYLNVLAESGLLGLAAMAWGIVALVLCAVAAWRKIQGKDRVLLIACLSAIAGLAVHSLTDTPQLIPFNNIFSVALIAQVAAFDPLTAENATTRRGLSRSFGLGIALTASLAAGTILYYPYQQGLKAIQAQHWIEAASWFDRSAERDSSFGMNWFAAGLAHGMAGLNSDGSVKDAAQVDQAIAAYERGLQIEDRYGPNWANLADLRWAQGDTQGALRDMRQAVDLAPQVTAFRITLGRMHEALGETDQAEVEYTAGLKLAPFLSTSDFFQDTDFRQEYSLEWQQTNGTGLELIAGSLQPGWKALADHRTQDALQIFENSPNAEGFLGAGFAALQLGQPEQAEAALRRVLFIAPDEGWTVIWAHLGLQQALEQQGRSDESTEHAGEAQKILQATGAYGPGRYTSDGYSEFIFGRNLIPADLLPGIDRVFSPAGIMTDIAHLAPGANETSQP